MGHASPANPEARQPPSTVREAESALRRLGYARVAARPDLPEPTTPEFWVQEPGVPRRLYPVFVDAGGAGRPSVANRPAILVVPDEGRAEAAWKRLRAEIRPRADPEVAILVLSRQGPGETEPHWHNGPVELKELLTLATGIIVGLFRRAAEAGEGGQVDFEEMLQLLRSRFHIDLEGTLRVQADEDALWMMYQLAQRYSYAPGDSSANLHLLVLKPTGPSARLPWFAA